MLHFAGLLVFYPFFSASWCFPVKVEWTVAYSAERKWKTQLSGVVKAAQNMCCVLLGELPCVVVSHAVAWAADSSEQFPKIQVYWCVLPVFFCCTPLHYHYYDQRCGVVRQKASFRKENTFISIWSGTSFYCCHTLCCAIIQLLCLAVALLPFLPLFFSSLLARWDSVSFVVSDYAQVYMSTAMLSKGFSSHGLEPFFFPFHSKYTAATFIYYYYSRFSFIFLVMPAVSVD